MKFASSATRPSVPGSSSVLITFGLVLAVGLTTACGSGGSSGSPKLTGNTSVTVLLSSTANDQLSEFDLGFQSITLTSQSGKTATLLSSSTSGPPVGAEFMHINGTAEPLVTASLPQDVYTGATVTLGAGDFVCLALGPVDGQESLSTATYSDLGTLPYTVSLTLATPLTITGTSMDLLLDLLVSQSATVGDCLNVDGFSGFSMTPTFSLTPLTLGSSPTNSANGKVMGVDGEITAIRSSGNSLTLSIPDYVPVAAPLPIAVRSDGNTMYQGISGLSALTVGAFVDLDGAIQSDGSLLAIRIAVEDRSAVDVFRGPLMEVTPSVSALFMHAREMQGAGLPGFPSGESLSFNYGSAAFQISGQLTNVGSLPFVPSFNGSNMVPGQEVYVSTASFPNGGPYPVATTMTLMPQTINGTVTASSPSGNFTDYTVSLASYDLFPMLAVQPQQTTVENNPSQVEVYVDSSTQLLNTQSLAAGSTLRFYGLVFNDNGTLRMDCAQVNDGVAVSPGSNASGHLNVGEAQTIHRASPGGLQQMITTVTRSH
ncbi:MAG: DUF5666 domain-containing protein [Candidatus Sulfotelmatobacter sp.]